VRASCDPCTVEVGKTATVTADAQDPDGDALTYRWTVPAGNLTSPTNRQTPWTAPNHVGPVTFTVTVNEGAGGPDGTAQLVNVVAPSTPGGSCVTPDSCSTSHSVKRLIAVVTQACVSDAAYLAYDFSTLNVPNAGSLPVTVTSPNS
jgi:hypothetical protein